MSLEKVLEAFKVVRTRQDEHDVLCPVHGDKHASASISVGETGAVLIHCMAGCAPEEIVRAAGLEWSDLFPDNDKNLRFERDGILVAEYVYTDEDSRPLYRVQKFRRRDGKKHFRQQASDGNGGWAATLGDAKRTLYHLPEVRKAALMEKRVLYVEGEACVEALRSLGLVATTHPGGSGAWKQEYAYTLHGAEVVILPDNDAPGRKMAQQILADVRGSRILELPGLPEKGDVVDWLRMGRTKDELLALLGPEAAEMVAVDWLAFHEETDKLTYYIGDWLAAQTLVMVVAPGSAGKTTFVNQLCICLAAGVDFLGYETHSSVPVLLVEAEGARPVFRSRAATTASALGIRPKQLANRWFLQDARLNDFDLSSSHIERHIRTSGARVVVLDTLGYFLSPGDENSSKDWKERVVKPMRYLRTRYGCTFMILHHEGKPSEFRSGEDRGRGTKAIFDDCDVWLSLESPRFTDDTERAAIEAAGEATVAAAKREKKLTWYKSKVGPFPQAKVLDLDTDSALFRVKHESDVERIAGILSRRRKT